MKNIYKLISAILAVVLLLCSCSTAVETPTPETTPTETLTKEPISVPTHIKSVKDIGQIVYAHGNYSDWEKSEVDVWCYPDAPFLPDNGFVRHKVEENVSQIVMWNYLGIDFELQYMYSGVYNKFGWFLTDDYVDYYTCKSDDERYRINAYFYHGTTDPIYVSYIFDEDSPERKDPLKNISYGTVDDYINIITLNNRQFSKDFSQYDLKCSVFYRDYHDEIITYTSFDEVKNVESDIQWMDVRYYPNSFGDVSIDSYVEFKFKDNTWSVCYYEPDFTDDTKPSEVGEETVWYAYREVEKFARDNFYCVNNLISTEVEYNLASPAFIPSETHITSFNGRVYLVVYLHLVGEFGSIDQGLLESKHTFYVDYERLQWKMALEGKN